MENLLNRFISYIQIDTTSDESSLSIPSSDGQLELAKKLVMELKEIGMSDVILDENGYIMASLPSNDASKKTTVGFIAHMDTSPDMSAKNVNVKKVLNYDGEDIILNDFTKKKIKEYDKFLKTLLEEIKAEKLEYLNVENSNGRNIDIKK